MPEPLTPDGSLPFSEVAIHRRKVRRLNLRVRDNGAVEMVGPKRLSLSEFEQFYLSKQPWVEKQRAAALAIQARKPSLNSDQLLLHGEIASRAETKLPAGDKLAAYRLYAQRYLGKRLVELSQTTHLPFTHLTVRAQRTRWGSCNSKGSISLNWRLVQMPRYVSDYIMIHELCHTQHMNHGPAFWQLVTTHCERTAEAKQWLKTNGSQLPD